MNTHVYKKASALALLTGALAIPLHAQNLTGEIDGEVRDGSGALITGVTVTITNTDRRQIERTLHTGTQGLFTAPLLEIGHYTVTAASQGFKTTVVSAEVHEGQTATLALALQTGDVQETVNVVGVTVAPQLENAAASSVISGTQVRELSLSSRNYEQLLYLQPGISGAVPGPLDRGNFSPSGATSQSTFSVNGQAIDQNGYFLDGQDMINHGGNAQTVIFPSIESVQEMSLLRNTYGAQYGGGGGAVFNVFTKAGASVFHGDAYEFARSQILNANNYFNNQTGVPRPESRYNDFGYYLGGPLWVPGHGQRDHSKTFFLVGQQFLREEAATTETLSNIPTAAQRAGTFTHPVCAAYNTAGTACTNEVTQVASIDATAQAYLKDVIDRTPLPNNPNGDAQGLTFSAPGYNNESQVFARIDHQVGSRLGLFFRYLHDP